MAAEIELKLVMTRQLASRLQRDPDYQGQSPARTQRLATTYFDSPTLDLAQRQMALRLRRASRRQLQTLKMPMSDGDALHRYREFEMAHRGDRPDLSLIDDAKFRRLAGKHDLANQLQPIFTTDFRRRSWLIERGESAIEIAIDRGWIESADRRAAIDEIEFELKQGQPAALYDLAIELVGRYPARIEWRTKAQRGYELFVDRPTPPQRAQPVLLAPDATAAESFIVIARSCIKQIGASQAAADAGEDPEGVHQFRVGLRRLRALVNAYRAHMADAAHAYLSQEFRWLQREAGAARDLDVLLRYSLPPIVDQLGAVALAPLLEMATDAQAAAYRNLREVLGSPRFTLLFLRLSAMLETGDWASTPAKAALAIPARDFADQLLEFRHRRLRKFAKKMALTQNDLHRLRLLGKKMRYVADFFRALYGAKPGARYLAALADLQDNLGSINDAAVTQLLLTDLIATTPRRRRDAVEVAASIVTGWQARLIVDDHARFERVWRRFRKTKKFW